MVIYCTYDGNNSSLVSRHRYVIAQNNNLSDRLIIKCVGMTDPSEYGYYIDFVCVTHGGAVKATYSSPALEYGADGLEFDIPNCLTRYEGYVEAQLVIYEKSRQSVVAKSVGRTGGIFEVAASVNSLETKVIEPANMLTELTEAVLTANKLNTEVAKTVEDAKVIKADIENTLRGLDGEITEVVESKIKGLVKSIPMSTVEFWFYDRCAASYTILQGNPVPEPDFAFPEDCVCGGWYDAEKGSSWDFAKDVAGDENLRLYADCHNASGLSVDTDGTLLIGDTGSEDIYLPFTFNGEKVCKVKLTGAQSDVDTVFVNDCEYDLVNFAARGYRASHLNSRYFGGTSLIRVGKGVVGAHIRSGKIIEIDTRYTDKIGLKFDDCRGAQIVIVDGDLRNSLSEVAKGADSVLTLIIKGNVADGLYLGDFPCLQSVIFLSDTPELMGLSEYSSGNPDCRIYVPAHYMVTYRSIPMWELMPLYPLDNYTGPDYSV